MEGQCSEPRHTELLVHKRGLESVEPAGVRCLHRYLISQVREIEDWWRCHIRPIRCAQIGVLLRDEIHRGHEQGKAEFITCGSDTQGWRRSCLRRINQPKVVRV